MKNRTILIWAVIWILLANSCQPAQACAPIPAVLPTVNTLAALEAHLTTSGRGEKGAVVIALDGARPDWLNSYMQEGTMPNLAMLSQRGVTAAYMQTVDPALPTITYLSLSTGVLPSQIGLVADKLPLTQNIFQRHDDLWEEISALPEPIWRTAMRSGLTTATLFWPVAFPDRPDVHADYMITTAESDIPAAQHVITLQEASNWRDPPPSFSPLKEGALHITSQEGSTVAVFHVLAVDTQDDAADHYDLLLLDDDHDVSNGCTELRMGKWASATVSPRLHSGAYFQFTASVGITATVYQSRLCYNQAYPADLLKAINAEFGFPPPAPDIEALQKGWLSPQQYYEMAERRAKWMMDVVLYVYQTYHPDLLLTVQDIIAQCARPFLLVDEHQKEYDADKAQLYASYLQKAHTVADGNLKNLLGLVNLADSAIFVLSAHGMIPVHTTVHVNRILLNVRLLQTKTSPTGDKVDENKSKAWAWTSGGSAHIYINLQGREWPGAVAPEDYEKVQEQIIQALEGIQDENGQQVFTRILGQQDLSTIHLDAPCSGDVFAQAAPGYSLSDELWVKKVLLPSPYYAEVGFDAGLDEMHGIFIAAGNGLISGRMIPSVHILDIAPTIAKALDLQPASTMVGHAMEGIWR
nr:alkaline phosphatase family protein [Chloroflexota bacterium]